jgi:hypothetical protein
VTAAVAVLERGWGKAPQTVNLHRDGELRDMSDAELIAIAASATFPDGGSGEDTSTTPEDKNRLN